MSVTAALVAALMLALAGCAAEKRSAPEPVELSASQSPQDAAAFAAVREAAREAAGAYVRVVVYGATEDEGMPDFWVVSGASGVIVDARGYVLTAAHIARDPRYRARITTLDGTVHEGAILDVAPGRDLALLKIDPFPGMRAARLADSARPRPGQPVFAIGTPDGRMGAVSPGRVTAPRRAERVAYGEFGFDGAIELEMEVAPGHSGGPLFDDAGRLLGVVAGFGLGDTRRVPYVPTRVAYAVPAASLARYLDEALPP